MIGAVTVGGCRAALQVGYMQLPVSDLLADTCKTLPTYRCLLLQRRNRTFYSC